MAGTEYTLKIVVQGEDRASGPVTSAHNALAGLVGVGQGMLSVFGGNLLSGAFQDITRWLGNMGGQAFQAAADFQMTIVQIQGLIAVQETLAFNQAHMVEQVTSSMTTLTGEQMSQLATLGDKYEDAGFKLAAMQERYNKAVEGGKTGAAALELQAHNIQELQGQMSSWQAEMAALEAQNGQWATSTRMVAGETANVSDFMADASVKAQEYLDWLTEYAVTTPATVQTLTVLSRSFLGANKSIEETKDMLVALTQIQAGMGLKDFQLNRIAYNLAQTQRAMKMTAADIREFGNAGVPVVMVLQTIADKYGISVAEAEKLVKSGKEGVQAWQEGLTEFAGFAFSDALENVANTWSVASSNVSDFIQSILGMEVIMPTLNLVSGHINSFISFLISNRGEFRAFGQAAAKMFEGWGPALTSAWTAIMRFIGVFATAFGLDGLFPEAKEAIEGSNFTGMLGVIDVQARGALEGLTKFADWLSVNLPVAVAIAKPYFDAIVQGATDLYNWLYTNIPIAIATVKPHFDTLVASITDIYNWLVTNIPIAIETVRPYFEWFLQNWQALAVGIGVAAAIIAGPAIIAAIGMAGTLMSGIALLVGPLELVAAAVGFFAAAWTGNWWGIRDTLTSVWNTNVQPLLTQLWNWLSVTISNAITGLSDLWTNNLLPAITAVWAWMTTVLFPFWESFTNFLNEVFKKAIEILVYWWETKLEPALKLVGGYMAATLQPILETVGQYMGDTLQPVVEALSDFFNATFIGVVVAVADAIGKITGALQELKKWFDIAAEAVRNFKVPEIITPGSPTPLELGLVGINKAMKELANYGMPNFVNAGAELMPAYEGLSSESTSPSRLGDGGPMFELHFHDVHVRSDQDLYDVAYKVAGIMQEQVR